MPFMRTAVRKGTDAATKTAIVHGVHDALVAAIGMPKDELFNIVQDPYEKKNLASEQPEKLKELKARYDKLAAEAVPPRNSPIAKDFKAPKVWGEKD